MDQDPAVKAARAKLLAKMGGQIGGKGTERRRKVVKHTNQGADDKQMQAQLKRLGMNQIPGIEEVNMFKEDGTVIHFQNPKVQAAVQANTFCVSGSGETKRLEELLPGIIQQLGPDNLASLKRLAEQFASTEKAAEGGDDDIPDVGESFEDVSKK
eukprot:TRINITY_DN1595_c0_g3_i1.p1 TRINITY_DN1595_c0_g3~~TRINITY_DN1595_c0_g3_i1.p1  ORF type:complete len:155 (+),score=62.66 TRINITY_DN1595_c0_g3_i1:74-538(+)